MAHFAELDSNNTVIRVIVIGNKDCYDWSGKESEQVGIYFCQTLFGSNTRWVQTSYNGSTRGKFAEIGDVYDRANDIFLEVTPPLPDTICDPVPSPYLENNPI